MKSAPKDRSGCLDFSVLVTGQLILLLFLTAVFIVIDFWPTYGTPFFRYTGSNPDESVWNLGFPIAWFIYDDNTPPNWFMSPSRVVYGLIGAQAVILLAGTLLPWLLRRK
ncbi:MAG: hypothetical protein U1F71_17175 [Verrucomicrobiaceae bacterium]